MPCHYVATLTCKNDNAGCRQEKRQLQVICHVKCLSWQYNVKLGSNALVSSVTVSPVTTDWCSCDIQMPLKATRTDKHNNTSCKWLCAFPCQPSSLAIPLRLRHTGNDICHTWLALRGVWTKRARPYASRSVESIEAMLCGRRCHHIPS